MKLILNKLFQYCLQTNCKIVCIFANNEKRKQLPSVFQRLGKEKLKYVSEIADSKASFEGGLAVKNRKIEKTKYI